MYKRLLVIAAAAALAGTPAFAADLSAAQPMYKAPPMMTAPNWTGFYIGGDIGGAWSHSDSSWFALPSAATFGVNSTGGSNDGSGFLGGVHLGYNYQFAPAWVAGLEGDWTWTHTRGSNTALDSVRYRHTSRWWRGDHNDLHSRLAGVCPRPLRLPGDADRAGLRHWWGRLGPRA
jgi:opacity protein-like surface antigen